VNKPIKEFTFVEIYNNQVRFLFYIALLFLFSNLCLAQKKSQSIKQLENEIDTYNSNGGYNKAVLRIKEFIDTKGTTSPDAFYAYVALSNTYKRIFDYDNVLIYLDSALAQTKKIKTRNNFYLDNYNCLKCFALFDIQHYNEANKIMQDLSKTDFVNIETSKQAYIFMQMAYIDFLEKKYPDAEQLYQKAIIKLKQSSPCDLPIVYGKLIALYAAQKNIVKVDENFKMAFKMADSCGIHKYKLYAVEMMRNSHKDILNDYKRAYRYFDLYDSLNTIYNADAYKSSLRELEVKYESTKKQQAIEIQEKTISAKNRLNAFLFTIIIILILMVLLGLSWQSRKRSMTEQLNTQRFTKQLLAKTEEERKRIAIDLHDSVNNELLLMKIGVESNPFEVKSRIDALIALVRNISRNLHPVMFDELGLQESIEQFANRIQEQNRFILNTEIDYKVCLNTTDELQLYRIIQEAVNNILKYSKAIAAVIKIHQTNSLLHIEIKDNGVGFNVSEKLNAHNSFGLRNIIERSQAINGKATIGSNEKGTIIQITIPINKSN
jgi:two-component system, NarL family, sensor kinase